MALTTGPNMGLLDNGSPGEQHYTELMRQWRWMDFWLQPMIKSRVASLPASGQVDGDAYIITAAGANQHKIARWTTRLATAAWEYVSPKTGWRVHVMNESDANGQVKTIEFVGGTWVDRVVASGGVASVNGQTGIVTLTAGSVSAIAASDKGAANGVASLDGNGKVPEAQLPAVVISDAFSVASEAAMLALTAQRGDVAIRSDINKSFVLAAEPAATLSNWLELRTPTDAVLSVAGKTGAVTLVPSDVGAIPTTEKAAANGVASLGADGKVPTAQLPAASANTQSIVIAASDETTALTAGTAKVTFRMPYGFTLSAVRASLTTAQATGNILTVDINEGGVSVLSTKLTIDNTERTSVSAAAAPVISDATLADDAEITIDIDQVGDGTAKGLKVVLIGTPI